MRRIILISCAVCIILLSMTSCAILDKTSKDVNPTRGNMLEGDANVSPTSGENHETITPTTAPLVDNKLERPENNQNDVPVNNSSESGKDNQTDISDDNAVELPEDNQTDVSADISNNPNEGKEMEKGNKLIVFGRCVPQGNCMVFHDNPRCVTLPFVAVVEALGAKVERESETIFEITLNGEEYVLNTETATLIKEASNINCIIPTPGGNLFYQVVEGEFLLDHITVRTVAMIMGVSIKIDVDYQNCRVVIDY